ncbi:Bifunctional endo-1,4-beta-xylanase xylA precursor, partial [Reticulomyxa filosa]
EHELQNHEQDDSEHQNHEYQDNNGQQHTTPIECKINENNEDNFDKINPIIAIQWLKQTITNTQSNTHIDFKEFGVLKQNTAIYNDGININAIFWSTIYATNHDAGEYDNIINDICTQLPEILQKLKIQNTCTKDIDTSADMDHNTTKMSTWIIKMCSNLRLCQSYAIKIANQLRIRWKVKQPIIQCNDTKIKTKCIHLNQAKIREMRTFVYLTQLLSKLLEVQETLHAIKNNIQNIQPNQNTYDNLNYYFHTCINAAPPIQIDEKVKAAIKQSTMRKENIIMDRILSENNLNVKCMRCNKIGHNIYTCQSLQPHNTPKNTCINCDKNAFHWFQDCPEYKCKHCGDRKHHHSICKIKTQNSDVNMDGQNNEQQNNEQQNNYTNSQHNTQQNKYINSQTNMQQNNTQDAGQKHIHKTIKRIPTRPCKHCNGKHWDSECSKNTNNTQNNKTEQNATNITQNIPPTPCKYCNGNHWNNECRKNTVKNRARTDTTHWKNKNNQFKNQKHQRSKYQNNWHKTNNMKYQHPDAPFYRKPNTFNKKPNIFNKWQDNQTKMPTKPCKFCNEMHWHNQCPIAAETTQNNHIHSDAMSQRNNFTTQHNNIMSQPQRGKVFQRRERWNSQKINWNMRRQTHNDARSHIKNYIRGTDQCTENNARGKHPEPPSLCRKCGGNHWHNQCKAGETQEVYSHTHSQQTNQPSQQTNFQSQNNNSPTTQRPWQTFRRNYHATNRNFYRDARHTNFEKRPSFFAPAKNKTHLQLAKLIIHNNKTIFSRKNSNKENIHQQNLQYVTDILKEKVTILTNKQIPLEIIEQIAKGKNFSPYQTNTYNNTHNPLKNSTYNAIQTYNNNIDAKIRNILLEEQIKKKVSIPNIRTCNILDQLTQQMLHIDDKQSNAINNTCDNFAAQIQEHNAHTFNIQSKLMQIEKEMQVKFVIADHNEGIVIIDDKQHNELMAKLKHMPQHEATSDLDSILNKQKNIFNMFKNKHQSITHNTHAPEKPTISKCSPIIKLHKKPHVYRPIISSFHTYKRDLSKKAQQIAQMYLDNIASRTNWCIKNSYDVAESIRKLQGKNRNYIMIGIDIKDFYNQIEYQTIIDAYTHYHTQMSINFQNENQTKFEYILDYYRNLADMSAFEIEGTYYKTIKGLAQGDSDAPPTAQIVRNYCEEKFLTHKHIDTNSQIFKVYGYMDDVLFIVDMNQINVYDVITQWIPYMYKKEWPIIGECSNTQKFLDLIIKTSNSIPNTDNTTLQNENTQITIKNNDNTQIHTLQNKFTFEPHIKHVTKQPYINPTSHGQKEWYLQTIRSINQRIARLSATPEIYHNAQQQIQIQLWQCGYHRMDIKERLIDLWETQTQKRQRKYIIPTDCININVPFHKNIKRKYIKEAEMELSKNTGKRTRIIYTKNRDINNIIRSLNKGNTHRQ